MRSVPLWMAVALILATRVEAQDLGGYLKNFSMALSSPVNATGQGTPWQVANRLRLKHGRRLGARWKWEAAWELSPRFQHRLFFGAAPLGFTPDPSKYRVADLDRTLLPRDTCAAGHFGLYQNLDRLSIAWSTGSADFILGRQAVAWGSARVINPTDFLAPFAFNELDKEEVFGVDALRVRIPTGRLSEIDLGWVAGRDLEPDQSALYLRHRTSVAGTDLVWMAAAFRNHMMAGIDVSGAVGQVGFNLETSFVDTGFFDRLASGQNYFRLSAGLDHSLTNRLYGYAEYHYSTAGGAEPAAYAELAGRPAYRDGGVYLLGRHYLSLGGSFQWTPLQTLSVLAISNLGDGSLSVWPSWEQSLAQDLYLSAGANIGLGKGTRPQTVPSAGTRSQLRSEFGAYPKVVYASLRFYF